MTSERNDIYLRGKSKHGERVVSSDVRPGARAG